MVDSKQTNNLLTYLLVGFLVVGAYFTGVYKTRSDMLTDESGRAEQIQGTGDELSETVTQLSDDDWAKLLDNPVAVKGSESAPVTIVEFTDYQCPFCARSYEDIFSQIMSDYIDTGKVRYILRDLPLPFHPNAENAAIAVRCAGEQDKYFEMYGLIFEGQADWEGLADAKPTFATYGDQLGINIRPCQGDDSILTAVQDDLTLANSVGATGTPTFFINGEFLVGAQPYANFQRVIDEQLAN